MVKKDWFIWEMKGVQRVRSKNQKSPGEVRVSNRKSWLVVPECSQHKECSHCNEYWNMFFDFWLYSKKTVHPTCGKSLSLVKCNMPLGTENAELNRYIGLLFSNNDRGLEVLNRHGQKSLNTNIIILIRSVTDNINSQLIHLHLYV